MGSRVDIANKIFLRKNHFLGKGNDTSDNQINYWVFMFVLQYSPLSPSPGYTWRGFPFQTPLTPLSPWSKAWILLPRDDRGVHNWHRCTLYCTMPSAVYSRNMQQWMGRSVASSRSLAWVRATIGQTWSNYEIRELTHWNLLVFSGLGIKFHFSQTKETLKTI